MSKKVFMHCSVYNSILSHKGVKKFFFTHRHEKVHKIDFKHECPKSSEFALLSGARVFKIDFMHELARSC